MLFACVEDFAKYTNAFLIQKIIEICFEHVLTGHRNEYTNTHLVIRVGRVGLLPYVVFVFRIRIIEILP